MLGDEPPGDSHVQRLAGQQDARCAARDIGQRVDAAFTRAADAAAGPGVVARAEALGVPAVTVDGNDVGAVDAAAAHLVAEIRGGAGPRLLHAQTYRHTGHTSTDPAAWRPADEVAAAKQGEPIARFEARLIAEGITELAAVRQEALAEMQAAPWPAPATAFTDVLGA